MLGYLALGALAVAAVRRKPSMPAEKQAYNGGVITLLPGQRRAAQATYKGWRSRVFFARPGKPAAVQAAYWIDAMQVGDELRAGTVQLTEERHDVALGHSPVQRIPTSNARPLPARGARYLLTETPVSLAAQKITPPLI